MSKEIKCPECKEITIVHHLEWDKIICSKCKSEIQNFNKIKGHTIDDLRKAKPIKSKRKEQKFITTDKCKTIADVNYYLYQHHNAIIDLIKINSNLFKEIQELKDNILSEKN